MSAQQSIGHYRIVSKIGEGGMGAVYRAMDSKLNREVAIKVLPETFAGDPDRLARFTREAQLLASLNHPNIAAIYGVEDRALVLELVDGLTLADRIAQGPIPIEDALPIARQIAEALEYAHERAIVHRDLKPANVMVTAEGRVKVLDFGLAKALSADASTNTSVADSPTLTMRATLAGVIMGTAGYMSPEQAKGKPIDRRADIWAFGVVLVEMLTGRLLYSGETVSETLAAVIKDQPDLSALPAGTPTAIQRLLKRCLEKDPLRRLQAIGEARIAIENASLPQPPATDQAAPPARRAPLLLGIVAAVLAIALAATGVLLWRATHLVGRPLLRLSVDVGDQDPFAATPRFFAILSPDGSRLVIAGKADGAVQLATRRLDQAKLVPLPGTTGSAQPFFSPDGQWIAFFADGKLKKISVDGGAVVTLCDAPSPMGAWWGEDGEIVAAIRSDSGLVRLPASGGTPRPLTELDKGRGEVTHRWPQILPGGKAVLFSSRTTDYTRSAVHVLDLQTGQRKPLLTPAAFGRYLPSGHIAFVRPNNLFAAPMDLDKMQVTGAAVPVLEHLYFSVDSGAILDFSRNGELVYASGPGVSSSWSMFWTDAAGQAVRLRVPSGVYLTPSVAPDGVRVAVSTFAGADSALAVVDTERDALVKLTSTGGRNVWPTWTPDGKTIIYSSTAEGMANLYCIRSDASSPAERLTHSKNQQTPYAVSPDGKFLAYGETGPGQFGLWLLPLNLSEPGHPKGGTPEALMQGPNPTFDASFSPDGRWLAYTSLEQGKSQVYVRPFPFTSSGGKWQVSTEGGRSPVWSRSGHELFYMTDYHLMAVSYRTGDGGFAADKPRPWAASQYFFMWEGPTWRSYDLAPDGKRALGFVDEALMPDIARRFTHVNLLLNFFDELRRRVPPGGN